MSSNNNNNIPSNNDSETGIAESFQHAGETMMQTFSNAGNALAGLVGAKTEEAKEKTKSELQRNERDTEIENAREANTMTESVEHLGKAASSQASALKSDAFGEKENLKAEKEKENVKEASSDAGNSITSTISKTIQNTTEYFTANNQKDTQEAHAAEKEKHWGNAKNDSNDVSERANAALQAAEEAALEAANQLE